jgi:hypothetical protein
MDDAKAILTNISSMRSLRSLWLKDFIPPPRVGGVELAYHLDCGPKGAPARRFCERFSLACPRGLEYLA